jgi:hypothetical protein
MLAIALIVLYALGALALARSQAPGPQWLVTHPLVRALALAGILPICLAIIGYRIQIHGPPASAWTQALKRARSDGWFGERVLGYLVVLVLLPIFFWSFAAWKSFIPVFQPFYWDSALAVLDRRLHGGDPYQLLAFLERPPLTLWFDRLYFFWHYFLVWVVLWQGWFGTRQTRARFWLAFVLTWILLGTVLATIGSSAGPIFYQRVVGDPGPYQPLLRYLATVPGLGVFVAQDILWSAHESGAVFIGGGISAFPSLHVAIPLLAACAAWRSSRALASAFMGFGILIWIGSIHLSWHYALDGEASALLVPPIWWLSGRLGRLPERG